MTLDFIHALVNIFAGGRSYTKVYLFLTFLVVLFVISICVKTSNKKLAQTARSVLIAFLLIGHLLGLTLFFYFTNQFNFQSNDFILTFNNNEISSTQLTHNHLLKGSIGLTLSYLGMGYFESIDAGLPFVGLVPAILLWLGVITVLLCGVVSIAYFRYTISDRSNIRKKVFYTLAFGLSSFSLIKSIVDGGIFSTVAIPISIAMLYGIYDWKKRGGLLLIPSVGYMLCAFILWKNNFLPGADNSIPSYLIAGFIPSISIYILFYIEKQESPKRLHHLLLFFLAILLSWPIYTNLSGINDYRNLNAEGGIVALYDEGTQTENHVNSIGKLNFYKIDSESTVGHITDEHGLLTSIYPVAIPWRTCVPTGAGETYSFTLLAKNMFADKIYENDKKIINRIDVSLTESSNGFFRYNLSITLEPCTPRHLNVIQEFLKTKLNEPFFMYNITQKN
jgi:hypothetical protein